MRNSNIRFLFTLFLLVGGLSMVSVACGDLEESCEDTDPESEADNCVCDDPEDSATCHTVEDADNNDDNNDNNTDPVNNDNNDDNNPPPTNPKFVRANSGTQATWPIRMPPSA